MSTTKADLPNGIILLYHAAFEVVPEDISVILSNNTPAELEQQLNWLKENYDVIDIDSWLALSDRRGKIAITFDDGYTSALGAIPILESLDIKAAFFLNGSMLDGNIFWRDKIRFLVKEKLEDRFIRSLACDFAQAAHLSAEGFFDNSKSPSVNSLRMMAEINRFLAQLGVALSNHCAARLDVPDSEHVIFGSHSYDHPNFASLGAEEAGADIRRNRDALRRLALSRARLTNVFALPFGVAGSYTDETLDILAREGYSQVLLVDYGPSQPPVARGVQLVGRLAAPSSLTGLQTNLAAACGR